MGTFGVFFSSIKSVVYFDVENGYKNKREVCLIKNVFFINIFFLL
jgi:hypothetical protein